MLGVCTDIECGVNNPKFVINTRHRFVTMNIGNTKVKNIKITLFSDVPILFCAGKYLYVYNLHVWKSEWSRRRAYRGQVVPKMTLTFTLYDWSTTQYHIMCVRLSHSFRSWAAAASPALLRADLRSSRVGELVLCSHCASMAPSQLTGAPCIKFGLASMFDSSPGRNPSCAPISLHFVACCESWPSRLPWWTSVSLKGSSR